jgi:hypothetical protein
VETIQTELLSQNRVRRNAAFGPETRALLEKACSGPMETWAENLRVLNISRDADVQHPRRYQPAGGDAAQQRLQALLSAGVGGRDDSPLREGWDDSRPVAHVRINKDLPAATPFDEEVREVLPSLAAAQRRPILRPGERVP